MAGKGSKRRPTQVESELVDHNWDIIFGGKNLKHENDRDIINVKISNHFSADGRKEAIIIKTAKGYMVELYEKSRYVRTVDANNHSLNYAEDIAENYILGVPL